MLNEMFTGIAEWIVSLVGVSGYCVVIVALALINFKRFKSRISPSIKEFENACTHLEKIAGEEGFAAEFHDFEDYIDKNKLLKHAWHEFSETLLLPEHLDNERSVIRNVSNSSYYFSRNSLLHSKVDLRYYSAFPNLLTGTGILGTFIGLVAGIYLASSGLAGQVEEAKLALQQLLGGAALAFTTSIFGLFSSIIFSWREKKWVHRFDKLLDRWNEGLDKRLERVTPESIARAQLDEAKQQTSIFSNFSDQLAFQIAQQFEEKITGPLAPLMQRLVDATESMRDNRATSNEQMLNNVVEKFQESISGAAGEEMKAFAGTVKQLNENFEHSINQLSETVKDIDKVTSSTQRLMEEVGLLLVEAKEAYSGLSAIVEPLQQSAESFQNTSLSVEQTAGAISDSSDAINNTFENISNLQSQVTEVWQNYQERFANVDQSLGKTFQEIDGALDRYTTSMKDFVTKIDEHTSSITRDLAGAVNELEKTIEGLSDAMEAKS